MKKIWIVFFIAGLITVSNVFADDFVKTFGGDKADNQGVDNSGFVGPWARPSTTMAVTNTSDGGFAVVGSTQSFGAGSRAQTWVLKFDSQSNLVWEKRLSNTASGRKIVQTPGGGFIVIGDAFTRGNYSTMAVTTLDADGNVLSSKGYSRFWANGASGLTLTADGGYAITGIEGGRGRPSVLKFGADGDLEFSKRYSGGYIGCHTAYSDTIAEEIVQTDDDGFVLVGSTRLTPQYCIDRTSRHDFSVVKLNNNGIVEWDKTYGDGYINTVDRGESIALTSDGGLVVAGMTTTFGAGGGDFWILKLDSVGNIIWQKAYGGALSDKAFSVIETDDDGFIVLGKTASFGVGCDDFWILRLDSDGNAPEICSTNPDTFAAITETLAVVGTLDLGHQSLGFNINTLSVIAVDTNAEEQSQCPSECGDGIVQFGERCDTSDSFAIAPHCSCGLPVEQKRSCSDDCQECISKCGNGLIESPDEECDDGNTVDGDGCSCNCLREDNDGDGVDDYDEIKFGTDRFDEYSFPVKIRTDTYAHRIMRVYAAYAKDLKGDVVYIIEHPRIGARLTEIVDQDGNPVVVKDLNGNIPSYMYSNSVYIVEKTPDLFSLEITAETTLYLGAEGHRKTFTATTSHDLTDALPFPAGPIPSEIELGISVQVYVPYHYHAKGVPSGAEVTETVPVEPSSAVGMELPPNDEVEESAGEYSLVPLADCCLKEDDSSPTGYTWDLVDGTTIPVEVTILNDGSDASLATSVLLFFLF